jgi:predicted metal-dependent phosphoesterase TrpH
MTSIRAAGMPTRTHLRALVALGAAADIQAAFDRWLGRGRPGHVASAWPALAEATGWILAAGGKAVIAHRMRYPLSAGAAGCAPNSPPQAATASGHHRRRQRADREQAIPSRLRSGLEGSVGSDFHDPAIPWNPPGRLANFAVIDTTRMGRVPAGMTDEDKVNTSCLRACSACANCESSTAISTT